MEAIRCVLFIRKARYRITDYNTESKNDGSKTEYDKLQEYAKYYDEYGETKSKCEKCC